MITRSLKLSPDESFFLLGPRGAGKKTLIDNNSQFQNAFCVNLLSSSERKSYSENPYLLSEKIQSLPQNIKYIIIHEPQKILFFIDIIAEHLKSSDKHFILSASNIRELKFASPNLLTGKPVIYNLSPLIYLELPEPVLLNNILQWGLLPKVQSLAENKEKAEYLNNYIETYFNHEILAEKVVTDTEGFKRFIELTANFDGEIIKYKKIARDCRVDKRTVRNYFIVLVDTFMGFFLVPFRKSFRDNDRETPKFYFFDAGVARAIAKKIGSPIGEASYYFKRAFIAFIITQCKHLTSRYHRDYRLSYFRTQEENEIELVVERPNMAMIFISINSSKNITEKHLDTLKEVTKSYWDAEAVCFCREESIRKFENITIYPWAIGIKKYFAEQLSTGNT